MARAPRRRTIRRLSATAATAGAAAVLAGTAGLAPAQTTPTNTARERIENAMFRSQVNAICRTTEIEAVTLAPQGDVDPDDLDLGALLTSVASLLRTEVAQLQGVVAPARIAPTYATFVSLLSSEVTALETVIQTLGGGGDPQDILDSLGDQVSPTDDEINRLASSMALEQCVDGDPPQRLRYRADVARAQTAAKRIETLLESTTSPRRARAIRNRVRTALLELENALGAVSRSDLFDPSAIDQRRGLIGRTPGVARAVGAFLETAVDDDRRPLLRARARALRALDAFILPARGSSSDD